MLKAPAQGFQKSKNFWYIPTKEPTISLEGHTKKPVTQKAVGDENKQRVLLQNDWNMNFPQLLKLIRQHLKVWEGFLHLLQHT